ncbi:transposase [Anditalea andensis]|uniref:transposase n=1 Tax=Anditalea andensis TaxID=1048983 RepID=UPI001969E8FF|nr:transposase [Anditalea andensis]
MLTRQLEDFNNQRTVFLNQLHALSHSAYPFKQVEKNLNKLIRELEKGIANINTAIEKLIKDDEKPANRVNKILKIKGVGIKTIAVLLAETNGYETFENQGQLVSYSGYDIVENQSGKHNGRTKMSKKGNHHIRRAMHLPAFGVVRYQEGPFKALYERLIAKGKTEMQAYVAVQRKLLILIWALWKKDQEYDPLYHINHLECSGNDESKSFFSLRSEGSTKKVGPEKTSPTVDELPCKESPLFAIVNLIKTFKNYLEFKTVPQLAVRCSFFRLSFKKEGLVTVSCRVWCLNCFRLNSTKLFSRRLKNCFIKSYSGFLRTPLLLQHQSQSLNMMNPILSSLKLFLSLFLYSNS